MQFKVLAADYDETIANDGRVTQRTFDALSKCKDSGLKLILVTGRELPDLLGAFRKVGIFDLVVAENGGLLYNPRSGTETIIGKAPPTEFVTRLRELKLKPLSIGRTIVSTREPNEGAILAAIRDLGLELHIVFNKGAVMVLPANVNKATGLAFALRQLNLSGAEVIGLGDAENDLAFLQSCGVAAAVDGAVASVKAIANIIVPPGGAGIEEISRLYLRSEPSRPKVSTTTQLAAPSLKRNRRK